jgi:hypothetical protein
MKNLTATICLTVAEQGDANALFNLNVLERLLKCQNMSRA